MLQKLDRFFTAVTAVACGVTSASVTPDAFVTPGRARLPSFQYVAGERDEPCARAGDFAAERRDRLRLAHSLAERPAVGRATRAAGVR